MSVSFVDHHLTLRARGVVDDATVTRVLAYTDRLLARREAFETTWDLRECAVPSLWAVQRCLRWASSRKAALDTYNTRMTVLLRGAGMAAVVRGVLWAFGPRCPVTVYSSM